MCLQCLAAGILGKTNDSVPYLRLLMSNDEVSHGVLLRLREADNKGYYSAIPISMVAPVCKAVIRNSSKLTERRAYVVELVVIFLFGVGV